MSSLGSPSVGSALSELGSPLPQVVAGRRAKSWKFERKRRILARAEEIAERCGTLARRSRSVFPACRCVNACGHRCMYARLGNGCKHGPCLTCLGKQRELCIICMDNLMEAPVVDVGCGHLFHAHCLRARIEVGAQHNAAGDPLLFDFLECPLCRTGIVEMPLIRSISIVTRQIELRGMVDVLHLQQGDGRYIFQVCQRCTLPYCSGEMACHAMARGKMEAICNPCSRDQPAGKSRICPVHGTSAIAWKCRYCCAVATFECFSGRQQLHVCDTCHDNRVLDYLFDFDNMANALPIEQYGTCPVRRNVYLGTCGSPMDPSQLKAIERRLAVVSEKASRCDSELEELLQWGGLSGVDLLGQNNAGSLYRLRRKAHSLRVEKEDLMRLVDGWPAGEALQCPFRGMHPPTGVEYCLGCTICEPPFFGGASSTCNSVNSVKVDPP